LGWYLKIAHDDWCWVATAIALVLMAEAFNTAVETLADEVSLEHRVRIGIAKDLGAGAVLIAALAALVIGLLVFIPCL